jgi:putative SOS response-associated peptidase YedK
MPVIIGPEDYGRWRREESLPNPAALLKPFPAERITMWPVDKRVGSVKNQEPALAEAVVL